MSGSFKAWAPANYKPRLVPLVLPPAHTLTAKLLRLSLCPMLLPSATSDDPGICNCVPGLQSEQSGERPRGHGVPRIRHEGQSHNPCKPQAVHLLQNLPWLRAHRRIVPVSVSRKRPWTPGPYCSECPALYAHCYMPNSYHLDCESPN